MLWFGMIFSYDMIWYEMTWYDMIMIRYDMIWYDMIWYDAALILYHRILFGMIWYDVIFYVIILYWMTWYDMIEYDMIWYDMIWNEDVIFHLFCLGSIILFFSLHLFPFLLFRSRPWICYWILHALYLLDREPVHLYPRVVASIKAMKSRPLHLGEENGHKGSWGSAYGGGPSQLAHGWDEISVICIFSVGTWIEQDSVPSLSFRISLFIFFFSRHIYVHICISHLSYSVNLYIYIYIYIYICLSACLSLYLSVSSSLLNSTFSATLPHPIILSERPHMLLYSLFAL